MDGLQFIMFHVEHCRYMDCSDIVLWLHVMQYNDISVSRGTLQIYDDIWMIVYDDIWMIVDVSWWMVDRLKDWNWLETRFYIPIVVYKSIDMIGFS